MDMESTSPGSRRKEAAVTFAILLGLTVLEVVVSQIGGHHRAVLAALIGLACVQGAVQLLYFMHLRRESRMLRLYVMLPLLFPVVYALALIGDGVWRRMG
jgi:caa(3)-type oxidase subunit IV